MQKSCMIAPKYGGIATMPIFDTNQRKQIIQVLRDAGYLYNFDRELYINRKEKKAFSVEFVEDHGNELEKCIQEQPVSNGWKFYFNSDPPSNVKQELERLLG